MFDCAYNLIICCMSLCTNFPVYSNCPAKCHILWYVLLLVVRMTLYNLHYRLCHISVIPQTIQSTHIRLSVGQWGTTNSVRQNDTQKEETIYIFLTSNISSRDYFISFEPMIDIFDNYIISLHGILIV